MASSEPETTAAGRFWDAWLTPGRFAGLLGLLIFVCFPQVITGAETFFYRDYSLFTYPLAFHHRESFWNGEMPLWNPLNNCGLPFTAQWNTITLYPLSLIYLLLPLPWSLGIFCLFHMFLAGMGMYFLGHRWTNSRLAAAVAGTVFAFNGLTWQSLMWTNNISALGWMPWVVLAVERAWRDGGRWIVFAALAGAMQMLAGAPEIILQTWLFLGVLWVAQLVLRESQPMKAIVRAGCVGVLVAGLAAVQLLPFLDLLAHSHRDSGFSDSDWAMPASGWANYLVPLFHCVPSVHGPYSQHNQYWTSSYYLGIGTVALALLAAWRARSWRVWMLVALALFSLTIAQGEHSFVYPMIKRIAPQMGFMRFPVKFVVLATFAIPLLAAHGVARLQTPPAGGFQKEWNRLAGLAVVLALSAIGILAIASNAPQAGDDVQATIRNGISRIVFLAAITGLIAFLHRLVEARKQIVFQAGLLALLWMDVFTHVPTLSPTVSPSVYQPGRIRDANNWQSQLRLGGSRLMQTRESLEKMYWGSVPKSEDEVLGRRLTFFDDINLLDDIPKADGFYSLYFREMNAVVAAFYTATNDLPHLKDFLGVSHINPSTNAMEWVTRDTALPLITGGQTPIFADDTAALNMLVSPTFDGRTQVILPVEVRGELSATNRAEVKIGSNEFSAHRISAQVEASGAAMVVVAQAFYHPWRAFVDGQPAKLFRANVAFQALEVPAGTHNIRLVYEDTRFLIGTIVSLLTLLICAGVWLVTRSGSTRSNQDLTQAPRTVIVPA